MLKLDRFSVLNNIAGIFLKVFAFFVMITMLSCNGVQEQKTGKNVITVSILPQKYFVERIAGDKFEVNVMIPPGANHSTYEPTARQMQKVSASSIYFKIGHIGFEKAWLDKMAEINREMKVVDVSANVDLIHGDEHDDCEGEHGGIEPHIWLSPKAVKIIAANIYNALVAQQPQDSAIFRTNYQGFISDIDQLDSIITADMAGLKNRTFLIFHPVLTYFARDYGLTQIAIELGGKEPTPAHLRELIDLVKKEKITTIFFQKEFDIENVQLISRETETKIVEIYPLAPDWLENMRTMSATIHQSLGNNENK